MEQTKHKYAIKITDLSGRAWYWVNESSGITASLSLFLAKPYNTYHEAKYAINNENIKERLFSISKPMLKIISFTQEEAFLAELKRKRNGVD